MSTAAIPVHVALVDASGGIDPQKLAEVAGALNEQAQADLMPAWKVAATVGAYPQAPPGTWRIELRDGIGDPTAAGFHSDEHHQPFALVDLTAPGDWTVTASHELLEMLVDPQGSRLHTADAPQGWQGSGSPRVRYVLELCDPCEEVSYKVGGVSVSDFLLPSFYRSSPSAAVSGYSHTGAIREPLQILEGGYISFIDPGTGKIWQRFVRDGKTEDHQLPDQEPGARSASLREWLDIQAREYRASTDR